MGKFKSKSRSCLSVSPWKMTLAGNLSVSNKHVECCLGEVGNESVKNQNQAKGQEQGWQEQPQTARPDVLDGGGNARRIHQLRQRSREARLCATGTPPQSDDYLFRTNPRPDRSSL